jgi:competence protein ComEA
VQWTLAAIASAAIICMLASGGLSSPRENGAQRIGQTGLRIDLNTAQSRELALLPGVGPVLAARIVANRERLGDFSTVQELERVYGIGKKTIQRLGDVCEVNLEGGTP